MYLCLSLSVCLCLYVWLYQSMSLYVSVSLFLSLSLSLYLSVYLSVCLYEYLSVCVSLSLQPFISSPTSSSDVCFDENQLSETTLPLLQFLSLPLVRHACNSKQANCFEKTRPVNGEWSADPQKKRVHALKNLSPIIQ